MPKTCPTSTSDRTEYVAHVFHDTCVHENTNKLLIK